MEEDQSRNIPWKQSLFKCVRMWNIKRMRDPTFTLHVCVIPSTQFCVQRMFITIKNGSNSDHFYHSKTSQYTSIVMYYHIINLSLSFPDRFLSHDLIGWPELNFFIFQNKNLEDDVVHTKEGKESLRCDQLYAEGWRMQQRRGHSERTNGWRSTEEQTRGFGFVFYWREKEKERRKVNLK